MRKTLAVIAVALSAMLAVPALTAAAATATTSTAEQELLLKKKKLAAQREAAKKEAARKEAAKKDAARKLAARKELARKQAEARKKVQLQRQAAIGCTGILRCMFGKRTATTRVGLRKPSSRASDYATAEVIAWPEAAKYAPGSIIVRTPERALYLVMEDGKARRYKVGVGREGFQWSGTSKIVDKREWPTWRPPAEMIKREALKGHMLPEVMEGGPENPLGARAMYIGGTIYRIHGTNNAASIGGAVSSGCIRMMNTDVIDLYGKVKIGARVYVYQ